MDRFSRDLESGEIHQRDKWQFELKSEFLPSRNLSENTYVQEFYIFIPNSLLINEETYPIATFYQDQTNLIRYKTPEFTLKELDDPTNQRSPLTRLSQLKQLPPQEKNVVVIEDELKLLGNIIRSSLRDRVCLLIEKAHQKEDLLKDAQDLCHELTTLRKVYLETQSDLLKNWTSKYFQSHFLYIDEFISNSIDYYLCGFLDEVRRLEIAHFEEIEEMLCELLAREKRHRQQFLQEPAITDENIERNEYILYRSSLLNKFVLDALLLSTTRSSLSARFKNIVGSISAGLAMLFFFVLFVWQGQVFLINSLPFIFITVLLYILKDRIKELLRDVSFRQFSKWFSDYKTEIKSPNGKVNLGKMKEASSYVAEDSISKEIAQIRNKEFHNILEAFKRPEQVIHYKKTITLFSNKNGYDARRKALNIIFRFDVSNFVRKADNPFHSYVTINPNTLEFIHGNLPKVYHVNIIMKNTFLTEDGKTAVELKKFRLILDKNGITRIEHLV